MILKLGVPHRRLELNKVYINCNPGLILTYFTTRSKMVECAFEWEKLFHGNEMG